ncbi:hypothetical protein [Sphingomonas sp. ABOLG]|uniref:hypothetical protein n=1 Tax=Sphingomonas sp. ABOLG TaxID=1985880 RepID=UPI000F7D9ADB|nr:hypothetical protein [Sphingomonas sp. ABOLG]
MGIADAWLERSQFDNATPLDCSLPPAHALQLGIAERHQNAAFQPAQIHRSSKSGIGRKRIVQMLVKLPSNVV